MAADEVGKRSGGNQRKSARLWWTIHHWVGLKLSILMAFILFTGTLAVFAQEIDWLIQPEMRVDPSSLTTRTDWGAMAVGAVDYPRTERVFLIDKPVASAFAARAIVEWEDGGLGYLYLHPATGVVQGEGDWVGAQRVLRNMHRHLNLPPAWGVPIVSSLAVLLLISITSSLIVYKKWWRGFLKSPRSRSARTWWGDFHRLAGVWSLWFVALIAVTSLWYLVESLGGEAPSLPQGKLVEVSFDLDDSGPMLAASIAAARDAEPALIVERVIFPNDEDGSFVIEGQKSAWLVRPRANAVWVAAETGKVLLATEATELNAHQRIAEMADPLHFGSFGGYWTKVPWFLFGLLSTAMAVSGAAVYSLRIARDARARIGWVDAGARAWAGMGLWRWLALGLVLAALVLWPEFLVPSAD